MEEPNYEKKMRDRKIERKREGEKQIEKDREKERKTDIERGFERLRDRRKRKIERQINRGGKEREKEPCTRRGLESADQSVLLHRSYRLCLTNIDYKIRIDLVYHKLYSNNIVPLCSPFCSSRSTGRDRERDRKRQRNVQDRTGPRNS